MLFFIFKNATDNTTAGKWLELPEAFPSAYYARKQASCRVIFTAVE